MATGDTAAQKKQESKQEQNPALSRKPDLNVHFAGIAFKNPIIAAAGTFGYGVRTL
jgi:hypothetical protein